MRICLVGPTYPFRGGISHYTTLLYQHLQLRHDTRLYSFQRQYPRLLFPGQTDRDPSSEPLVAPCEYLIDPVKPWTWWRTAQRVRVGGADLLVLQWTVPYWAPMLAGLSMLIKRISPRTRLLFICHNVAPRERELPLHRVLMRWALRHGDHFIVHSQADRAALLKVLPAADVRQAFHPTYAPLSHGRYSIAAAKTKLGLAGPVALFFGLVRPYKGLEILIEALPVVRTHIALHTLVVGEFWVPEEPIRSRIRQLGLEASVTIVNRYVPNEDLDLYFAAADVVVLPYLAATQSGVVQLAYGFGKPVITTAVGGLPDAVIDGETGLLVPPGDHQALADAIVRYFESGLAVQLTANVRSQRWADAFSWEKLVEIIETL